MSSSRLVAIFALCGALATPACLPNDTRPPPAAVSVRLIGSPLVKNGIPSTAMDDGWSVTFDKFLVTLGDIAFRGDPCTAYSDAGYMRIFDARVLEPQKISLLYALGTCNVRIRLANPTPSSPLGLGVANDDELLMRMPGSDQYGVEPNGITIYVKGSAQRASVKKTFAWSFRSPRVQLTDCTTEPGAKPFQLVLDSDASVNLDIQLHGEALFQDHLDPAKAKLRFTPFANADDKTGNGDGDVTLDELGKVTLDSLGLAPDVFTVGNDAGGSDSGVTQWKTFEDFVYLGLFPSITRLGDRGTCVIEVENGAPD